MIRSSRLSFLVGACFCASHAALGQEPFLLKDLTTTPAASNGAVLPLGVVGGNLLFLGNHPTSGLELFKTDGTSAGTSLVADIRPGGLPFTIATLGQDPYYVWAVMNGVLYLSADDGTGGTQLWRSDGTASGTWRVKRLYINENGTSIQTMVALGNRLVFTAPGTTNNLSLWISDGTEAGTVEIQLQPLGISNPSQFGEFGGDIVFMGEGGGLWRTDGTQAGTQQLVASSASVTPQLMVWNGSIYFSNASSGHGSELWKSDGTVGGTSLFVEINPGSSGSNPRYFTPLGNNLCFFARDADHGQELWKTDGTVAGTQLAVEFTPGSNSTNLTATPPVPLNGGLLLNLLYSTGPMTQLWMTDGTQAGTITLSDPSTSIGQPFTTAGSAAYFAMGASNSPDQELWRTDGTLAGTYRLKDVCPGSQGSFPRGFLTWGSKVYFTADDGVHGTELWKTDGFSAGTVMVADISGTGTAGTGGAPAFIDVNDRAFFVAPTFTLRTSDGTTAGTQLLKQFDQLPSPPIWANVGGTLLFAAQIANTNHLWKSDGTVAGTVDVTPAGPNLDARSIVDLNGVALFNGRDSNLGYELWRSDGTQAGTSLVLDISPGPADSSPSYLHTFGNIVLFFATTPATGAELWRSDGTAAGTWMVADIRPGSASSTDGNNVVKFVDYNGYCYFSANDGTHGYEIWRTDGTPAGTSLAVDVYPGPNTSLSRELTVRDGWLYFTALDGQSNGFSLFKTDGTQAGTSLVKRFGTMTSDSYYATDLRAAADALYFSLYTGASTSPLELWRSDGTTAGTTLVRQLGPHYSFLSGKGPGLTVVDGRLYYPGYSIQEGVELWTTDGTEEGTHEIEIVPGPGSGFSWSNSLGLPVGTASGHYFYFMASNEANGQEPWAFILPTRPFCAADYNHDGFVTGDDFDAFSIDFDAGNQAADVDGNGFVNGDDFDYFTQHFDAGC